MNSNPKLFGKKTSAKTKKLGDKLPRRKKQLLKLIKTKRDHQKVKLLKGKQNAFMSPVLVPRRNLRREKNHWKG